MKEPVMLLADNVVSVWGQQAPGLSIYTLKIRCYHSDEKATIHHQKPTGPLGERKCIFGSTLNQLKRIK